MPIDAPKLPIGDEEGPVECQYALELVLAQIIDQAQTAGWRQPECFDAVDR